MKRLFACLLLAAAAGCTTQPPAANSNGAPAPQGTPPATAAAVPYSLALEGFQIDGFPGLHSSVVAGTPDKLILIGGRRNGLHGFPNGHTAQSSPSFPKTEANDTVYALDLVNRRLLGSASVASLPAKVASQFKATNTQYETHNGWLYVIGGYGPDPKTGTLATLGYVTAVNLDALTSAVVNRQPLDAAFAAANVVQFDHPALAITGGDLGLLPDPSGATNFVLVFGQKFDGEYTTGGGLTNQIYSDGIRVFQFAYAAGGAKPTAVNFIAAASYPPPGQQLDPENPYHRRDFTMQPSVDAAGKARLAVYGGVFKGGRFEGFLNPVFIGAGTSPAVTLTPNTATSQLLSQYDTATIQLYDDRGGAGVVYTTFFGGISQYYWDDASQSLKRDAVNLNVTPPVDGLPFVSSVSTLKTPTASDAGTQYLHTGQSFPPAANAPPLACSGTPAPYAGTETRFVPAPGVPQAVAGVIRLSQISSPSVVGYMVGGIAATGRYAAPTCASNVFYQVTLNPSQPTATVQLQLPPSQ